MLNFTRQERVVIYFLVITLGVGAILKIVRNKRLEQQLKSTRFYAEEQRFKEIASQINSKQVALIDSLDSKIVAEYGLSEDAQENLKPGSATINLNVAGLDELSSLPGIGPAIARRIRTYIDENGPFENKADIVRVKGIGQKLYARIEGFVTIE